MYCSHARDWPYATVMMMRASGRNRRRSAGQRKRFFGHGDLRLLLLGLIAESPRHGYDLISEIEHRSGGVYKPSPGVIYPTLEVMQDLGWVEAKTETGRKTLFITDSGKDVLKTEADTIAALMAQLEGLSKPQDHEDPADVRTAMRRLRHTVIKSVIASWPHPSDDEEIVEILNAARKKIADLKGNMKTE